MRPNRLQRSQRALLTGLAISLAVHVGTLALFGRAPLSAMLASVVESAAADAADTRADRSPETPVEDQDPLQLGIAESDAVTINWIGFESPTEHRAEQSTSDQPALALNPGSRPTPLEPPPESDPLSQPAQAGGSEAVAPRPQEPAGTDELAESPGDQLLEALYAELTPVIEQLVGAAAALAAPPGPPSTEASEQGGDPGEASDRDSDPTALAGTIEVIPGHPAAHKGLEIKTVRPRWLTLTQMTTTPDNPTVIIKFRRNGTVFEADFDHGRGTGFRSVDGPLLDAVYAWRASGVALARLPAGDPDATLEVRIRVILR